MFTEFSQHVEKDYNLNIRICSDVFQAIDFRDGDDDIISLFGLLSYEEATMSYMIYRRNNYEQNYVLDHCRYLNDDDTIIINSWKFEGYMCWEDLDCAIKEARLVLAYPGKTLNLEIWCLWYFFDSYGMDGLYDFVEAVTSDRSKWPAIQVWNIFPSSFIWDFYFIGIALFDLYAPLFRIAFRAF